LTLTLHQIDAVFKTFLNTETLLFSTLIQLMTNCTTLATEVIYYLCFTYKDNWKYTAQSLPAMSTSEGMGSHVEYYMNQTSFNRSHSMKIN